MKNGIHGNSSTAMTEKEILESVGETCSADCQCENCTARLKCRKDIYERYPQTKYSSIFG